MTVKDLRRQINSLPSSLDEALIIQASDEEGNSYSPTFAVCDGYIYDDFNGGSGDVYMPEKQTADDVFLEEGEWEEKKRTLPKCIIFMPTA